MRSTSRFKLYVVLLSVVIGMVACQSTAPNNQTTPKSTIDNPFTVDPEENIDLQALADVVVLYDDIPGAVLRSQQLRVPQQYLSPKGLTTLAATTEDAAKVYAQMVMNLVGGIRDVNPVMKPVSQYQAGDAQNSKHTIYIGSTFDNAVPAALIQDIAAGAHVTWVNYNIWQMGTILSNLGISYNGIQTANSSAESSAATTYNTIDYRGYNFKKDTSAGMEMVLVGASGAAEVITYAKNASGGQTPYVIKSGNFWYVADLPTTYLTETDRYLVFADLLPQMVGVATTCSPKAVIRLEDISPFVNSVELGRVVDTLTALNVPFGVATFPYFVDEPGGTSLTFANNPDTLNVLKNAQAGLGEIFQHGSFHMYQGLLNPSGISGLDWEFWNINTNMPLTGFTADQAVARIQAGKAELEAQGLLPVGWVTPHYAAPVDFLPRFKDVYFRQYERRFIASGDILTGQFMPYPVRDIYNRTLLIPENTNFIGPNNSLANIYEKAKANRVLNCPWLGMFVHPYIFDPAYTQPGATSIAQLQQFIADVRALGYEFVRPSTVDLNPIDTTPTPTFDGKVTGFRLTNGSTGADLGALSNGASFNLSALPATLNIVAETSGAVESVTLNLNGTAQTDNTAPYSLSAALTKVVGSFSLSATPYALDNAGGTAGTPVAISFTIVDDTPPPAFDGKVTSFSLVNAATNTIVGTLSNNATIDFSQLGTDKISIIANVSGAVESVKFVLNGSDFKTENLPPYSLLGDDNGVYGVWQPAEGNYSLEAKPYAKDDAAGDLGQALSISFKVTKGSATQLCSKNSSQRQYVKFINDTKNYVKLYWIDYNCNAKYYGSIRPGASFTSYSYVSHVWRLADYNSGATLKTVQLDGSSATSVVYVSTSGTTPTPQPDQSFTSQLVVQYTKGCMDAWSTYPFQWTCNTWDGQKFDFKPVSGKSGVYTITSRSTGQCMDIESASTSSGAKLMRYSCHGNTNQQFELKTVGSNYQLMAVHSNKCIAVTSSWGGAGFVQTTCNSTDSKQVFQLPGK